MNNWLAPIIKILEGGNSDLRDLALSVGADPRIFYMNQDLSQCDLRDQDLRGMNLTGSKIHELQCNENTKIDEEFDPREDSKFITKRVRMGSTLHHLVQMYMERVSYIYMAPAIKSLTMRARQIALVDPEKFKRLFFFIKNSKKMDKIIFEKSVKTVRINTTKRHDDLIRIEESFGNLSTKYYNIAIIMALIVICRIDIEQESKNIIDKIYDYLGNGKGLIPMYFEEQN